MISKIGNWAGRIFAITLLLSIGFGIYFFAKWVINALASIGAELMAGFAVICATALFSLISVLFAKHFERKTIILSHLREKKSPVYEEIINLIFAHIFAEKTGKGMPSEKETIEVFTKITQGITVWGSDEMLLAYHKFRKDLTESAKKNNENYDIIATVADLLLAIRKDLGHNNKNISRGTILELFINDLPDELR